MSEREQKIAAMLLSALVTTDEAELEDFRRTRLPRGATVAIDDLKRLRALLLALGDTLRLDDAAGWQRVREHSAPFVVPTMAALPRPVTGTAPFVAPMVPPEPTPLAEAAMLGAPAEALDRAPFVAPAIAFEPIVFAEPVALVEPATLVEPAPLFEPAAVVELAPLTETAVLVETPVPPPTLLAERIGSAPLPFGPARLPSGAPAKAVTLPLAGLDASETTSVGPMAVSSPTGDGGSTFDDPLPFRRGEVTTAPADAEPLPDLSLEAYASVRALCSAAPDRRREVLARYGIHDSLAEARLDARWRKHFDAHPADAERYAELFASYRDWFDTHGDPSLPPI